MRVDYVLSRILPELDVSAIQASLPSPICFRNDITWRDLRLVQLNVQSASDKLMLQNGGNNSVTSDGTLMTVAEEFSTTSSAHSLRKEQ